MSFDNEDDLPARSLILRNLVPFAWMATFLALAIWGAPLLDLLS
jgi:hypothetical protein